MENSFNYAAGIKAEKIALAFLSSIVFVVSFIGPQVVKLAKIGKSLKSLGVANKAAKVKGGTLVIRGGRGKGKCLLLH